MPTAKPVATATIKPTNVAPNVENRCGQSIPALAPKIHSYSFTSTRDGWLTKNGLHSPIGRGFGLARDNPAAVGIDKCRYDACVELEPIFEERAIRDLGAQTLPGGSYVRERRIGGYQDLCNQVSALHAAFEAPSGLMRDDRRPLVTIYLDDPRRMAAAELRSDFCVPVKAKTARSELEAA